MVSSTSLSAGVLGRGWRVAGSTGTKGCWNSAKDVESQPAPHRHRHAAVQEKGCSKEEGDAEAHQGQPCQTGGGEKRKGLNHRQLQH